MKDELLFYFRIILHSERCARAHNIASGVHDFRYCPWWILHESEHVKINRELTRAHARIDVCSCFNNYSRFGNKISRGVFNMQLLRPKNTWMIKKQRTIEWSTALVLSHWLCRSFFTAECYDAKKRIMFRIRVSLQKLVLFWIPFSL